MGEHKADYLDEVTTEGGLRQEAKFWREKFERADEAKTLLRRALDEWECEFAVGNPTIMAIKDFLAKMEARKP